jgi:hypothetical protein
MNAQGAEKAIFPLDNQLELTRSVYSSDLAQQMVWLSRLLSYCQDRCRNPQKDRDKNPQLKCASVGLVLRWVG